MKKGLCSGFTMIETMIATAIIVVIASAVFQLLAGGRMFYGTAEPKIQAQEHARLALDRMMPEFRQAHPQFVYIKYSTDQGDTDFLPIENTATDLWEGDSILFKIPCRYADSGAVLLDSADATVIYGAQYISSLCTSAGKGTYDALFGDGDWHEELWIEYFILEQPEKALARRVWRNGHITFATLVIPSGANPVQETILSHSIDSITFRTNKQTSPDRLEIAVIGRALSSRGEGVTSLVESGVTFRNSGD